MKQAWIEDEVIRDLISGDPAELFHPDVAVLYGTTVPENAERGDGWVKGKLVKAPTPEPVEPAPVEPSYPKVSPIEFKLLFTAQERVAMKVARENDPMLDDFFSIVDDPRLTFVDLGLASTQGALMYLTSLTLLAPGRMEEILTGEFQ